MIDAAAPPATPDARRTPRRPDNEDQPPRVRRALARFALTPERADSPPEPHAPTLERILALPPGRTALINGPSGSGKSTLMRHAAAQLRARSQRVLVVSPGAVARSRRPVIECVPAPIDRALDALAAAGLAEARLLARPAAALSEGERYRLALARAIARAIATPGPAAAWLLCDEFCSTLDRATAESVASAIRKWARRHAAVRILASAAHEDTPRLLRPDLLVTLRSAAPPAVTDHPPARPASRLVIEHARIEDFDALAAHHYRAGRPATWTRVLRATRLTPHGRVLAAVLVVSRPTLNAAWRDLAWPGRYTDSDRRARADRLNRELRCISRVVVEPRSRAMGAARRLVTAYLRRPETPATEALASMGAACPFFERAGMRPYRLPHRPPDARLRDALRHAGWSADDLTARDAAARTLDHPFLARELRRWANASRATRALLNQPPDRLATAAGLRLAARPTAYAHTAA